MNVAELIQKLSVLPPQATVGYVWDGEVRSNVEHVWLARNGEVVLADSGDVLYSTECRPVDAPDASAEPDWSTPTLEY